MNAQRLFRVYLNFGGDLADDRQVRRFKRREGMAVILTALRQRLSRWCTRAC